MRTLDLLLLALVCSLEGDRVFHSGEKFQKKNPRSGSLAFYGIVSLLWLTAGIVFSVWFATRLGSRWFW